MCVHWPCLLLPLGACWRGCPPSNALFEGPHDPFEEQTGSNEYDSNSRSASQLWRSLLTCKKRLKPFLIDDKAFSAPEACVLCLGSTEKPSICAFGTGEGLCHDISGIFKDEKCDIERLCKHPDVCDIIEGTWIDGTCKFENAQTLDLDSRAVIDDFQSPIDKDKWAVDVCIDKSSFFLTVGALIAVTITLFMVMALALFQVRSWKKRFQRLEIGRDTAFACAVDEGGLVISRTTSMD
ncbi:hypothetical protein BS50DRAFT_5235 [Corynespora cassiicola Philippines]|uniref:Extracellular membrane protein CFEM domain-containing protein n=1 Tax=Corynespora cassiicola Philippines TaxID=1448308 RepID=A0A2T2P8J6_CORCC|nr:hypothetical protein BS50DRAFT_5235 [Corynespora cassiicola Philippines]